MKILITGGSGFIGTYLIDVLREKDWQIINIDVAKPSEESHNTYWKNIDLLDLDSVVKVFSEFAPDYVVHLAARTDTDPENTLKDYIVNTDGTKNILHAVKACPSIKRFVLTSTQFVHQYKGDPQHDQDFAPHTVYGESKVISEKMTREANLACCWTIIRPTNIWGPRHPRYPTEFWKVLKQGKYVHPGKQPVIRSYGYVGNVADQIVNILTIDESKVNKQVFYVGDKPINLFDWANGFSKELNHKNVKVVPRFLVKGLALAGDLLRVLKVKFPITSSRYKSMTHENTAPMDKTFKILGQPKFTLEQGIKETGEWLRQANPNYWS